MRTVELIDEVVRLIDQRRLPLETVIMDCTDYLQVGEAIRTLAVRGAPAIGVTAASGMALAALALRHEDPETFWKGLHQAADDLRSTRPTAVNLFWGIQRIIDHAETRRADSVADVVKAVYDLALAMGDEDITINKRMASYGETLIPDGAGLLTHCNTGALATVDYGTALGVIRMAHEKGKKIHLFVDETRPVLQGARLTAWECIQHGIPATLITDNMAAHIMKQGRIQACFVGADRIAANGDTANKIGTYGVAILAKEHGIPFYVVAPASTVDLSLESGEQIPIEERNHEEVTQLGSARTAPIGIKVANPAFDVTPAKYITAIVTDHGLVYPPFTENLTRLLTGGVPRA